MIRKASDARLRAMAAQFSRAHDEMESDAEAVDSPSRERFAGLKLSLAAADLTAWDRDRLREFLR